MNPSRISASPVKLADGTYSHVLEVVETRVSRQLPFSILRYFQCVCFGFYVYFCILQCMSFHFPNSRRGHLLWNIDPDLLEDFSNQLLVVTVGAFEVLHPRSHCKRLDTVPAIVHLEQYLDNALFRKEPVEVAATAGRPETQPRSSTLLIHLQTFQ